MTKPTRLTAETLPRFLDNLKNEVYMVVWSFSLNICHTYYRNEGFAITSKGVCFYASQYENELGSNELLEDIHSFLELEKPNVEGS